MDPRPSTPPGAPLVYEALNLPVFNNISRSSHRILDLGCGAGNLGAALKARQECFVCGVTFSEGEAQLARTRLDEVAVADLNQFQPASLGLFDTIVCSHILEHLLEPGKLLAALREHCAPHGQLIVALPNILYFRQRLLFLRGRFRYTHGGLMDHTHFRFFDWTSAQALLRDAGYRIEKTANKGHFPLPGISRLVPGPVRQILDHAAAAMFPGLFCVQFVFVCQPDL